MIGQFEYNNISSGVYDVYFNTISKPLMPSLRPKTLTIAGKSGLYDFGDNQYDVVPISIKIFYVPKDYIERKQRAREISSWLSSTTWHKLIFPDETDKYYLARVQGQVDMNNLMGIGEAQVNFICQPFAYSVVDVDADDTWEEADYPWIVPILWDNVVGYSIATTVPTTLVFDNDGTTDINFKSPQGSKFDIKITGSFTILSLTLNGKTLNYNQAVANGTVTINNIDMEVDLNGVNKLNFISGDIDKFLTVVKGANILSIGGTGLNVTVTVDFKPMYL